MRNFWRGLTVLVVATTFFAPAEAAPDCKLVRDASLDMTILPDGKLAVPVTIGTSEKKMIVSLHDSLSYVFGTFADSQSFRSRAAESAVTTGDGSMTRHVILPNFQIGMAQGHDIPVYRMERDFLRFPDVVGLLGTDLLRNFDVELDFKSNKLNLFSQDHCPGAVVYWAKSAASVPLQTDEIGHITISMELDGKPLTVAFDTSPGHARMTMATAQRLFDVNDDAPGLKTSTDESPGGLSLYTHPFKILSVPGVAIYNPSISILGAKGDRDDCNHSLHPTAGGDYARCFGYSDLTIGLTELRALHIYIAFKEKMMYITGADAHL